MNRMVMEQGVDSACEKDAGMKTILSVMERDIGPRRVRSVAAVSRFEAEQGTHEVTRKRLGRSGVPCGIDTVSSWRAFHAEEA